jgi:predicted ester cyclase
VFPFNRISLNGTPPESQANQIGLFFKAMENLIKKITHRYIAMSSTEHLREVVRKLADTFNNLQNRESDYFDFYDDDLIIYGFPPNLPANKEGFKQFIYLLWNAFPDIRITFEDIIIEGNKVACRYNLTGTHKGEFLDLRPFNKKFIVNGMTVFSFRDAKCMQRWNLVDMISLLEQLKTQS